MSMKSSAIADCPGSAAWPADCSSPHSFCFSCSGPISSCRCWAGRSHHSALPTSPARRPWNCSSPRPATCTVPVNTAVDFRVEVGGPCSQSGFTRRCSTSASATTRPTPCPRKFVSNRRRATRASSPCACRRHACRTASSIRSSAAMRPRRSIACRCGRRRWLRASRSCTISGRTCASAIRRAVNPNIETLRGTSVTLTARTNRTIESGELKFQPVRPTRRRGRPSSAELVPDQPNAIALPLRARGRRQVHDRLPHHRRRTERRLDSVHDQGVERSRSAGRNHARGPGHVADQRQDRDRGQSQRRFRHHRHAALPANRRCREADAVGAEAVSIRKVVPIRRRHVPALLDYKDFMPLDQLKTSLGSPVALKAGMVIEYWLEADDNCDSPEAECRQVESLSRDLGRRANARG